MRTLLKKWSKTLFIGLFLVLIFCTALFVWLDSTHFKGFLSRQALLYTGRHLSIQGPIIWRIGAGTALELYDLKLSNAPHFDGDFLTLKKATIHIDWLSILSVHPRTHIQLEGLSLYLSRNLFGQSNWSDLKIPTDSPVPYLSLAQLQSFQVRQANIYYSDRSTGRDIRIQNAELQSLQSKRKIPGAYQALSASWTWQGHQDPKKPQAQQSPLQQPLNDKLTLAADWRFNAAQTQIDVQNIQLGTHTSGDSSDPRASTLNGELHLKNIDTTPVIQAKIQIMNLPIQRWFDAPAWGLHAQPIHLKATLRYQAPDLEIASFAVSVGDQGSLEGSWSSQWPLPLSQLKANGFIEGNNIAIERIPLHHFKAGFEATAGVLRTQGLEITSAGIQHQGELVIDFSAPVTRFALNTQASAPEIQSFLSMLPQKPSLDGQLKAKMQASTDGNTLADCLHHLTGKITLNLKNGWFGGISLIPLLEQARTHIATIYDQRLAKKPLNVEALLTAALNDWKQQALHSDTLRTPFEELDVDLSLSDQMINTDHLKMTHAAYCLAGTGTNDYALKQLHYQIWAQPLNTPAQWNPALRDFLDKTPLLITAQGPLEHLSIEPGLGAYAQTAIEYFKNATIPSTVPSVAKIPPRYDARSTPRTQMPPVSNVPAKDAPTNTAREVLSPKHPSTNTAALEKLFDPS